MADNPISRKENSYECVKRWRIQTKRRLVIGFGGKCGCCKLEDHDIVFDFHHLDPSEKDFQVTTKIRPWAKIAAEARKCAMLCSHCHRKVHSGLIKIPDDVPVFDEALIQASEYAVKAGPDFKECPVCKSLMPAPRKACSVKCSGSLRTSDKKPKDIPALADRVREEGYVPVAKSLGVCDNTLRKWMRAADVEPPRFKNSNIHL